jgi:hypothetical protein
VNSGNIYQIKLEKDIGYCYAKLVDFSKIHPMGLLIKVYDFFEKDDNVNIDDLEKADFLFNAKLLYEIPKTKERNALKLIGNSLNDKDLIIPDFRYSNSLSQISPNPEKLNWYPVYLLNKTGNKCDFESVSHLEDYLWSDIESIKRRTVLEYISKYNPSNLSSYLEDESYSDEYLQMKSTTYKEEHLYLDSDEEPIKRERKVSIKELR